MGALGIMNMDLHEGRGGIPACGSPSLPEGQDSKQSPIPRQEPSLPCCVCSDMVSA